MFLLFRILFSLAAISIFAFHCKKNTAERILEERESGSTIVLRNYTRISYNEKGVMLSRLKANESYIYPTEKNTILYGIHYEQFDNGKFSNLVIGDRGTVNHTTKKLDLKGNVSVESKDKRVLKTESIFYDMEQKTIESNDKVTILTDSTKIEGIGLRADQNLNKYTILKPIGVTRGNANPLKK